MYLCTSSLYFTVLQLLCYISVRGSTWNYKKRGTRLEKLWDTPTFPVGSTYCLCSSVHPSVLEENGRQSSLSFFTFAERDHRVLYDSNSAMNSGASVWYAETQKGSSRALLVAMWWPHWVCSWVSHNAMQRGKGGTFHSWETLKQIKKPNVIYYILCLSIYK